jgi:hypothetical protein
MVIFVAKVKKTDHSFPRKWTSLLKAFKQ